MKNRMPLGLAANEVCSTHKYYYKHIIRALAAVYTTPRHPERALAIQWQTSRCRASTSSLPPPHKKKKE